MQNRGFGESEQTERFNAERASEQTYRELSQLRSVRSRKRGRLSFPRAEYQTDSRGTRRYPLDSYVASPGAPNLRKSGHRSAQQSEIFDHRFEYARNKPMLAKKFSDESIILRQCDVMIRTSLDAPTMVCPSKFVDPNCDV